MTPAWQTDELGEEWVESTSPPLDPVPLPTLPAPVPTLSKAESIRAKRGSLRMLGHAAARALPPSRSNSASSQPRIISSHSVGGGIIPSGEFMVPPGSGLPSPPSSRSSSGDGPDPTADVPVGTFVVKDGVEDDRGRALAKAAGVKGKDIFGKNALEKMFEPPSPPQPPAEPLAPSRRVSENGAEPRRPSHAYAPANPSRLSKSTTPSTVSTMSSAAPSEASPDVEQSGFADLVAGDDTMPGEDATLPAEDTGLYVDVDDLHRQDTETAGEAPPRDLTLRSGEVETDLSPLAQPNYPFTFAATVRSTSDGTGSGSATVRGGSQRIFEPSLEPLESGEPSHSTLNRRPQRGHGVSPTRSSRPGLRLFRSTYDTYTREHLSALVDSIAIEPSPSPTVSNPRDSLPRDWSPSPSLSDRSPSTSASRSGSGTTSSSGGESRSSKRIRLSAPSPRRGPRDWGAQGRAMMDRIRVRAEDSTTSASRSRTSGEDEHSDNVPTIDYRDIPPSPPIEAFLSARPDRPTHRSNPSTTSSGYLRAAEEIMGRIKSRVVSDSASGVDSSPGIGGRRGLSPSDDDNLQIPDVTSSRSNNGKGKGRTGPSPRRILRRLSASEEIQRAADEDSDGFSSSPPARPPSGLPLRRPTSAASSSNTAHATNGAPLSWRPSGSGSGNANINADDLNRFVSATTIATTTTMSTSFVKHPGPRTTGKGLRMIRPDEVQGIVSDRVGKMRFDREGMRWVRESSLGKVDEAGESRAGGSEESEDIFAAMESLREDQTRGHQAETREADEAGGNQEEIAWDRTSEPRAFDEESEHLSEPDEELQSPRRLSPPPRPTVHHANSAPAVLTPGPSAPMPIRSALRNRTSLPTPGLTPGITKRTGFHEDLTPAPGDREGTASGGKRSVSFSDGRKSGKIRDLDMGAGQRIREPELEKGGGDGNLFDKSGGSLLPSARTRRIQEVLEEMDELSLDEVTPSKPSRHPEQIREPATDISAFFRAQPPDQQQSDVVPEDDNDDDDTIPARSFGRLARPRKLADATFLTECSFGVAHDALVKLITDVQPFEPYWEELRSIDLRGKGVDSVARLKEFLPKLEEIKLNQNAISYLSGIPSSVRTLHVPSNRLTSLTSVNHLRNLQYLDISRNQLDSVSQLSCLVHLRELKADHNKISSLDGILDMDGLIRLSAKSNRLERLDLVDAKWTRLEVLELADNTITAVKGLESLSSLRVLNLDDNDLTSLAPSRPLTSLRELRVNNNDLYTLDLTDFPRLKTVYADENRLRTLHRSAGDVGRIEALSMRNQRCSGLHISARELESVKRLYISGNEIKPTFFLESPLYKLEYLEAVACRLSAWPARMVDRMPGLRVLNLNYNFLDHLDGLSGMTGLRRVTVVGNRLGGSTTGAKVMRGLKGLTGLEEVDLRMNPSTLGFYLPVLSHPSSPEPADIHGPSNSYGNGNGNKTAILLGRPNYTILGASQTSRAGEDRLEDWTTRDREFRKTLPDEWYSRRLAYRGMIMGACTGLRMLDGLEVTDGEKRKARELLRRSVGGVA